jgi:hypothetical protein
MKYALVLLFILSACGAIAGDDYDATVVAGDAHMATESAAMDRTALAYETTVAATVVAAGTLEAQLRSVNDRLYATIAAGSTPTVAVVPGQASGGGQGGDNIFQDGNRLIVLTGLTNRVDNRTGCVVSPMTAFSGSVEQIYVTMQSFGVPEGTLLRAEWFYEGQLRVQQDWRVDMTAEERCLWFLLDRTDTEFTPGSWEVMLYVDEQMTPVDTPLPFTIEG